jgi:hypothetical protein
MAKKSRSKQLTQLSKYTVLVPKTTRATKKLGKSVIKTVNLFFKNSLQTVKRMRKNLDKGVARSISTLTRRRR